jgi:hypothetical protein
MPYLWEAIVIVSCVGWAVFHYRLIQVDIEINGEEREK